MTIEDLKFGDRVSGVRDYCRKRLYGRFISASKSLVYMLSDDNTTPAACPRETVRIEEEGPRKGSALKREMRRLAVVRHEDLVSSGHYSTDEAETIKLFYELGLKDMAHLLKITY